MIPFNTSFMVYLMSFGFMVGVLSGFFGFGGGFIITPFLINVGVPANIAVGTSLAVVVGNVVFATIRHRRLEQVDLKLGVVTGLASLLGVEAGAQLIDFLERLGTSTLNRGVEIVYVSVLAGISVYTLREVRSSMNEQKPLIQRGLVSRVRAVKLPPLISFSHSGIESLSLWTVVATGLVIGFLSGFMGAGGGFVRMPAFIYLIGCTTIIAVGTSLFADIFSGGYGLFTHALKGNLDLTFAVVILVGILMGVIVGVERSKNARGVNVRYMFSIYLGLVAFSVLCHLLSDLFIPHPTGVLCEGILLLASVLFAAIIIIQGPRD